MLPSLAGGFRTSTTTGRVKEAAYMDRTDCLSGSEGSAEPRLFQNNSCGG